MRLIGTVKGEKEAYQFSSFLQEEGIECSYEPDSDQEEAFQFWVMHEDEVQVAAHWLEEFQKDPGDSRFSFKDHPIDTQGVAAHINKSRNEREPLQLKALRLRRRVSPKMPITRLIVLACVLLYMWNSYQIRSIAKESNDPEQYFLTPLMVELSYDMPIGESREKLSKKFFLEDKVGNNTVWDGLYRVALGWPASKGELGAPMFVQIRQGEIWRLLTPIFLHGSFLHILFNMLWLWMLGRQVEERVKKWQYMVITIIIGVLSNTFQYFMSGPLFIGYSGVVCGLAGFIWMRQKRAPWEGYPLERGTTAFLAIFVVAMVVLRLISFFLIRFQIADFSMSIAKMSIGNTAHVAGAIVGMVLGRIPFFSKGAA